jgi:hypothetical protein
MCSLAVFGQCNAPLYPTMPGLHEIFREDSRWVDKAHQSPRQVPTRRAVSTQG